MSSEWLTLAQAAEQFGYHPAALTRRLRQLRDQGHVADIGSPPAEYAKLKNDGQIVILWANPKAAMIRADAPADLLKPQRGRPSQSPASPQKAKHRKSAKRDAAS